MKKETWYSLDRKHVAIIFLGETPPEGYVNAEPLPNEPFQQYSEKKKKWVKDEEAAQEHERQQEIAGKIKELENIDKDAGASRHMRDMSISAGVVLDAVLILLTRFASKLNISLPEWFGSGVASAEDIIMLAPDANATETEKENFAVHKALLLVSHYDPAINPGLKEIRKAELRAIPIRLELEELTHA